MATRECIKINIFWHVLLKNHALDIVKEQLRCMKKSGLYTRANNIIIGCIYCDDDLKEGFNQILFDNNKLKLIKSSCKEDEYEFLTLDLIYYNSNNLDSFYGLYIHTKGVSYPGHEGGKFWLDYMNHYNIINWREAVKHLDKGYDLYGVKLLTAKEQPAFRMHYSGNFFWFWSDYISTLKDPQILNRQNRGDAEMWVCSNHPVAGTGCQVFVDYNTKGKFKPFKIESNI